MIRGFFHDYRPCIFIVVGSGFGVQEIPVLVDTGFTGELKIQEDKALELRLKTTHTERVTIGDESKVEMQASLARVSMEGATNTVNVLIGRGRATIGVGLLRRFSYMLNVDFKYSNFYLEKSK